ncbi:L-lysine 2,3-aminomutase [Alkalispirillum mobile]|uniref:L-lysine 2,3-aminomutase n=1 Tax=Alkalispirillum mobile TaxID=85925 RepID=A0A498C4N7_9GAMM|nr:lysine 2,3-aminomutase [Alkalispirillum mobile]RLK50153.1 L-lysine 2,3-aminomutase [Alkalispirillum mobile]
MSQMLPLRPVGRDGTFEARRFQVFTARNMDKIPGLDRMPEEERFAMRVVANVLPFRVNEYVINELIDWEKAPDDPIYQLTIPQRGMLAPELFDRMADVLRREAPREEVNRVAWEIRNELNPHPAGQMKLNVPEHEGDKLEGMQHKYNETVLFFPSQGQVCHSYCTFCFRWAQFVGDKDLQFASNEAEQLHAYLRSHHEVSDLLLTGGDPMVMKTKKLESYLDPLLSDDLAHVQTVRLGTKALTFWPYRFVTDKDADDLLRLFERLVNAGRHVALMAHYNHPQEISTPIAEEAIRRIRDTGVEIRAQGPLLAHINDDSAAWAELWRKQVRLGIIPYYMFVERDTGARHYFEVPLARAWEIYREAMKQVSGLSRTARGPSMSAGPGKVEVQGVAEVHGEKVFVLRFIQGRNPDWVQRPFFAKFDPEATWLDQLQPAFGEDKFFFQDEYDAMLASVESD